MNKPAKENSDASTESTGQKSEYRSKTLGSQNRLRRILIFGSVLVLFAICFILARNFLDFDQLVARETALKEYYRAHPVLVWTIAFLMYILVTGLSIPISTFLSLVYAWFFGFLPATILISFASTAGATMAFLISRYVLRDIVQTKFRGRLALFNAALEKEGAFFLFLLRLVPVVPFFIVNAVMGLTKMKAITFWWISQLGMLAGTVVYVYAGSRIPDLETLHKQGVQAVFSPWQLTEITFAVALIGILPYVLKRILVYRRNRRTAKTFER